MDVSGQFHAHAALTPEERVVTLTYLVGGSVGLRTGQDDVETIEISFSCRESIQAIQLVARCYND
jgi:hypothetical protein